MAQFTVKFVFIITLTQAWTGLPVTQYSAQTDEHTRASGGWTSILLTYITACWGRDLWVKWHVIYSNNAPITAASHTHTHSQTKQQMCIYDLLSRVPQHTGRNTETHTHLNSPSVSSSAWVEVWSHSVPLKWHKHHSIFLCLRGATSLKYQYNLDLRHF